MREIKFRAWDKQTGDWLELYEEDKDTQWYNPRCNIYRAFFDKHVELMQYTGLKDKNGKEIYEGDIVRVEVTEPLPIGHYKYCTVVKWEDDGFHLLDGEWVDWKFEVIGNIWENPELLESEAKHDV